LLGILLVDKPPAITSHDVIDRVRRRFGTRRVGHAGTLDPLATGLLLVAVGPATRFLQYLPLEPKEYVATIRFGQSSDTYDGEGELSQERPVPADLAQAAGEAIPQFLGLIDQLPPLFSAIKVKGKPLYRYAREGKEIERETRRVHIGAFEVESVEGSEIVARIVCSGGTYIRSLAHDLGQVLGCGAYLSALQRTGVGRFRLDQARPLDDIDPSQLIPLSEALPPMPILQVDDASVRAIREGRPVDQLEPIQSPHVALQDPEGRVFSIAKVNENLLQPECVIPAEAFSQD
jgi:tRNA pseudouridine55 synthase